ncbi:unnamed protein product [Adineta steineri]|uniref:UBC core domain-containing protein n=1 Tax=Adineta steineri TaxID=433720 RepID=A0A814PL85_9BILA|nr:unnamed protein product [Adineta steineri]CAF1142222.1 unnamed protein product [Adineta steineri]CAF3518782.1 unnamed protein product [Adineta steineri]CAF4213206.1 unnamed protein product [Adineta steineri]
MSESMLNKRFYADLNRLKLCNKADAEVRFLCEKTPFDDHDDDDDKPSDSTQEKTYSVIGQIFPNSEIYKTAAYRIEMILPKTFPLVPPQVRFLTPIYHPNIEENGKFCNDLLVQTAKWKPTTSLIDVVKIVVKHVDEPDVDNPVRAALGVEYKTNRPEFDRHALESVKKHGLPRS